MNLDNPLAVIDVEGTGTDPETDAIWEYGCSVLMPDGSRKGGSKRFKPWREIPPEVCEKCHITNEELADCPPISEWMPNILRTLRGKHVAGYNLRQYDLAIIDAEARRCGLKLEIDGLIVDAFNLFRKKHERKLADYVRIYCGEEAAKDFEGHTAGGDADWTLRAMLAQIDKHEDLAAMEIAELAAFSRHDEFDYLDWPGKLYRDKDGEMCFSFGKNKGRKIRDEIGYARWVLSPKATFPASTCEILAAELKRLGL